MKVEKFLLSAACLALTSILASGCGKGPAGSYNLTQTMPNSPGACSSSTATMSVSESGSAVTGSASNACFNETLSGTDSGSTLTAVTLTMTQTSQAGAGGYYGQQQYPYTNNGYGYGYSGYGGAAGAPGTACMYTGSLSFSNHQVSGTLSLQYGSTYSSSCPPTITLNATSS